MNLIRVINSTAFEKVPEKNVGLHAGTHTCACDMDDVRNSYSDVQAREPAAI